MTDQEDALRAYLRLFLKHGLQAVGGILVGVAAVIASCSPTVTEQPPSRDDQPVIASPSAATPEVEAESNDGGRELGGLDKAPLVVPASRKKLLVTHLAVHEDGSMNSTKWNFLVQVDARSRVEIRCIKLNKRKQGVVSFFAIGSDFQHVPPAGMGFVVKGWRGCGQPSTLREPDAIGQGYIQASGVVDPVIVSAASSNNGHFTFYFSTESELESMRP